jgi:hypothetical protein
VILMVPENSNDDSAPSTTDVAELRRTCQSLWRVIHALLFILLILTGSVCLFFVSQVRVVRQQVRDLSHFVTTYQQASWPVMIEFRTKLFEFAKTHPDFMPIFTKYFTPTNATPGAAPTGAVEASPVRLPPGAGK